MTRPVRHVWDIPHHRREELPLLLLEFFDTFLDRARGNHAIDENRILLPDAVDAVDGLGLHGRIPPRVEEENVLRRIERDPSPTCLQRRQEQGWALGVLKPFNGCRAILGLPRQFEDRQIRQVAGQGFLDAFDQRNELGEHDRLRAVSGHLSELRDQERHFARVGARTARVIRQEARVATDLP